ncbi:hypothetical protein BC943DRAFT_297902 [Umbelopsis sp. AD052]|nr:hypothetical protein BC943DRAFT_297902 [Umbelopsis sp. AD052]
MQNGDSSQHSATYPEIQSLTTLNQSEDSNIINGRFGEQQSESTLQQAPSWRNPGQTHVDQMYVDSGVGKHFSSAFNGSGSILETKNMSSDDMTMVPVQVGANGSSEWKAPPSDAPIASAYTAVSSDSMIAPQDMNSIGSHLRNGHISPPLQPYHSDLDINNDMDIKLETTGQMKSELAQFDASSLYASSKTELDNDALDQRDLKESLLGDLMPPSLPKTESFNDDGMIKQESTPHSDDEDKPAFADYPCATAEAMTRYQHITANIYKGSATGKSIAEESMPCECKYEPNYDDPSAACGDDDICINRMMFMECMEDDCPCGRYCRNRRFQLQQYSSVDVIRTEKKGYGLRALADLECNQFIMEYIGEVIPNSEFIRRTKEYSTEGVKHFYFMTLKSDEIIDATRKGCLARFINHSCRPNCVTQKWVVGKTMRIGIFTSRNIKAGEELTFDYKFERYGAVAQPCYCGEPNCKGVIGGTNPKFSLSDLVAPDYEQSEDEAEIDAVDLSPSAAKTKLLKKEQIYDRAKVVNLPLQSPDEVQMFVKKMLGSVGKSKLVQKLLHRLELTDGHTSNGREILKRFVRLHGLKMLKFWLGEWKNEQDIVKKVLTVLEQLPLANRNGLEDSDMFDVMTKFTEFGDEDIEDRAKQLLQEWSDLKSVYRIPKRIYTEQPKEIVQDANDEVFGDNHSITEGDTSQTLSKKRRYSSSRDFYEPPDDYYEHLPLDITLEDLERRLRFPPVVVIPTAPRAMLAAAAASAALASQAAAAYQSSTAEQSNSYYATSTDVYPVANDQHGYDTPRSGTALPLDDSTLPTGPAAMQAYTALNRSQSSRYSSPTTEIPTQPAAFTAAASAAAAVAAFTSTDHLKLPPNWKAAYSAEGSLYYYNTLTNQSQWEPPEGKVSSIEGVDQNQIENLVATAIMEAERKKKTTVNSYEADVKRPSKSSTKAHSTSISKSESTVKAMSEVELKKEVGKVVTKYLSSKQKSLWQGDKELFKELARKITHHIVEREAQSSRKIQAVNAALRTKIETYIDSHGHEAVNKLKRKRKRSDKDEKAHNGSKRSHQGSRFGESDDHSERLGSASMDCSTPSTSQDITPMQEGEDTSTLSSLHSSNTSPLV